LPSGIQTAIASLSFQYGANLAHSPNHNAKLFWKQVTHGQWDEAEKTLRNFQDPYTSRRLLEADQMHKGIEELKRQQNAPGTCTGGGSAAPSDSASPMPAPSPSPTPTPTPMPAGASTPMT
jgi:hypothetical protein